MSLLLFLNNGYTQISQRIKTEPKTEHEITKIGKYGFHDIAAAHVQNAEQRGSVLPPVMAMIAEYMLGTNICWN